MKFPISLLAICVLGPAVGLAQDKPKLKLTDDEQKVLDMTNKERTARNLPTLKINETLTKVARGHSANMAKQGKMEHVLDGKGIVERVLGAGYEYAHVRENIAAGHDWSIDTVMKGWLDSRPHRENMLADDVDEIGIGIVSDGKGNDYYTQVFAKKRKE
jgi:uncharacterized protein YkwD